MKGKKKVLAIVLTVCLIVSSLGITSSVMATEQEKDVQLSVQTDKTVLKAGDEVTVSVNLDKFKSSISDDKDKLITTMEFDMPFDTSIFEYVNGSVVSGYVYADDSDDWQNGSDCSVKDGSLHVAAVYKTVKQGAIEETDESKPFVTITLKVKDTVTKDVETSFNLNSVIMKNLKLAGDVDYSYSVKTATVEVYTNPVVTVNDSSDIAETYTKGVTINAGKNAVVTVNGEEKSLPYKVSAAGVYTVVATNPAGLTTTKTFSIVPVVESIEIVSKPDKTDYVKGTALDLTGGVIKAVMSNGETKNVSMTEAGVVAEGYNANPDVFGTQTVTITYEGKQASFTVNVKDKEITSVEWVKKPADTIIEGQSLSEVLAGAEIKVSYDDGTSDVVAVTAQMCEGYTEDMTPQQTVVTVNQGGKTVTFDLRIVEKTVTDIKVSTLPAKTDYIENQELDLTGAVLTVSYDNGQSEELDLVECGGEVTGHEKNPAVYGTQTLTVTYLGKTTTFNITVRQKVLESIDFHKVTVLTEIIEGQKVDFSGSELIVTYDNGDTKIVPITDDMVTYDNVTVGDKDAVIRYEENGVVKETTLKITVKAKSVSSVELVSVPANTIVLEGKELDLTGAKITVYYDNGTKDENVDVTEVSGFDNRKIGNQTVTVKYNGVDTDQTFEVTVMEKTVTNVKILSNEVTQIKEGKKFTFAGSLEVSYDNGDVNTVNFTDASVKVDGSQVDTAVPGKYEVSVVYTDNKQVEHTLTYEVSITEKVLTNIKVTTKPSKTSIIEGTSLDVGDGILTAYYDNGTTAEVAMTNDMISKFDNKTVGTQTVTVTYQGLTTELEVTVAAKSVTQIELVSAPANTVVTEGLSLDVTGGQIKVYYDNGTDEVIAMTESMVSFDSSKVGTQTAVVTYGNKTVTFEVTVETKKPVGLVLTLTNKDLAEGTALENTGLEIYFAYNNNTKDTLSLEDVTIEGYDAAKLGKQELTVKYSKDDVDYEVGLIVYVVRVSEIKTDAEGVKDEQYLTVSKENRTEVLEKVEAALKNVVTSYEKYEVLDIKMLDKSTGLEVQPDGNLKVTMTVPEGFNQANKLTVYRAETDGTMTKLETEVKDGKISFVTEHLSTYVIVEEKVQQAETEKPAVTPEETTTAVTKKEEGTSVKTGDMSNVAVLLSVIALAGAGFVVAARRKEQM